MLIPRIASLTIAVLSAALFSPLLTSEMSMTEHATVFHSLVILAGIAALLGTLIGFGGVIASFGLEVPSPGVFRPKKNLFGRLIGKLTSDLKSFCGASFFCGFTLFAILACTLIVGVFAYEMVFHWTVFVAHMPQFVETMLQLLMAFGVLALVVGVYGVACRIHPLLGLTLLIAGVTGLIMYGPERESLSLNDWIPQLIATAIFTIIGTVTWGLVLVVKKFHIYRNICPVRA